MNYLVDLKTNSLLNHSSISKLQFWYLLLADIISAQTLIHYFKADEMFWSVQAVRACSLVTPYYSHINEQQILIIVRNIHHIDSYKVRHIKHTVLSFKKAYVNKGFDFNCFPSDL